MHKPLLLALSLLLTHVTFGNTLYIDLFEDNESNTVTVYLHGTALIHELSPPNPNYYTSAFASIISSDGGVSYNNAIIKDAWLVIYVFGAPDFDITYQPYPLGSSIITSDVTGTSAGFAFASYSNTLLLYSTELEGEENTVTWNSTVVYADASFSDLGLTPGEEYVITIAANQTPMS